WCCVYTFQNLTLYPRPWMLFPELVPVQKPTLWHEGLPASAPAISVLVTCMLWRYAKDLQKKALLVYAVLGCVLSVVSGINWPADVNSGAVVGFAGACMAPWYCRLGAHLPDSVATD